MNIQTFKNIAEILKGNENFYIVSKYYKISQFTDYKNWIDINKKFDIILKDIETKEIRAIYSTLKEALDYVKNYYTNLAVENVATSILRDATRFFKNYNLDLNVEYLYKILESEEVALEEEESQFQDMKDELIDKEDLINNLKESIKNIKKEIECLQAKK